MSEFPEYLRKEIARARLDSLVEILSPYFGDNGKGDLAIDKATALLARLKSGEELTEEQIFTLEQEVQAVIRPQ